ncbi:MAG: hypothetical protein EA001_04355 [Oscillatoriales cyanobacterium]|nr:MAG: hypothetical protein EA001_04355 [Oscillatoriales cyanobacterium]
MAKITLYQDYDFSGNSLTLEEAVSDLSKYNFNDHVSSLIIEEGEWNFYRDVDFAEDYGITLGPGEYPCVDEMGIDNDDLSSLQPT